MDVSFRTGIISFIYIKGDQKDIANYRPVSLLNFDYKIYTIIFKNRMQTLDAIIGEKQSAGTKNSSILHTLSTIGNVNDIENKLNNSITVISLYFLKAFNRIDSDFIFSALSKFGYEDKFIHMIEVAYTNIQSKIKINGLLSHPSTLM